MKFYLIIEKNKETSVGLNLIVKYASYILELFYYFIILRILRLCLSCFSIFCKKELPKFELSKIMNSCFQSNLIEPVKESRRRT